MYPSALLGQRQNDLYKNIRLMNLANGIYLEEFELTIQYLETL
jgi:hypothetical protein